MVVPALIRRILMITGLTATVIGLYWARRDPHSAAVLVGAAAWAMANLVVWSVFSHALLRQSLNRGILLICAGLAKLILFGGGLAALVSIKPLSRAEVIGLAGGLSLTLLVSLLLAVGACLSGREMSDGQPSPERRRAEAAPELGGKA